MPCIRLTCVSAVSLCEYDHEIWHKVKKLISTMYILNVITFVVNRKHTNCLEYVILYTCD